MSDDDLFGLKVANVMPEWAERETVLKRWEREQQIATCTAHHGTSICRAPAQNTWAIGGEEQAPEVVP